MQEREEEERGRTPRVVPVAHSTGPAVDLLARGLGGVAKVVRVELHARLCARARTHTQTPSARSSARQNEDTRTVRAEAQPQPARGACELDGRVRVLERGQHEVRLGRELGCGEARGRAGRGGGARCEEIELVW